jgi:hypothetical protein
MIDDVFWTVDDALAGRCAMADVGSRRPAPAVADPPMDDDIPYSEQLKQDAMLAYKALGGTEYLRRNPELLDKTLLKMVAEPDKRVDTTVKIVIDAPWMSPDRLSYHRQQPVIDVTDAQMIESAPPNTPLEVAQARAEHEAANRKAKDKEKALKAKRVGAASYQRPKALDADAKAAVKRLLKDVKKAT